MKIVLTVCSLANQDDLDGKSETYLAHQKELSPLNSLKSRWQDLGFHVLTRQQLSFEQADMAVFWNIDKTLYKECLSLPEQLPCLLIFNQSPLVGGYKKLKALSSKRWLAVLTWNRSFQADHIFHYDIPFFYEKSVSEKNASESLVDFLSLTENSARGVAFRNAQNDTRGLIPKVNSLCRELANSGYIDLVEGREVLSQRKIEKKYHYSLVAEDALCPGYVTQKLADSIIAGIPAIYLGDFTTAERRFPGCFVRLKDLSVDSFMQAKQELLESYDNLHQNIVSVRQESHTWGQNFLEVVEKAVIDVKHRRPLSEEAAFVGETRGFSPK
jgi:hypothetical protein